MTEEDLEQLQDEIDQAERLVHELSDELANYEEVDEFGNDNQEWFSVFRELTEAENHLHYLRSHLEDEGYC